MTTQNVEEEVRLVLKTRLLAAKADIDAVYYRGYAENKPELVAAYMQAAAYEKRTLLQHRTRQR